MASSYLINVYTRAMGSVYGVAIIVTCVATIASTIDDTTLRELLKPQSHQRCWR